MRTVEKSQPELIIFKDLTATNVEKNGIPVTQVTINLHDAYILDYRIHKKIFINYVNPWIALLGPFKPETDLYYLKKSTQTLEITEGEFSAVREEQAALNEQTKVVGTVVGKKSIFFRKSNFIGSAVSAVAGAAAVGAAASASGATIAIVVKYFAIVDLLTNFFGKVNVKLGPRIRRVVTFLKKLQFPTFAAAEATSPINDGGKAKLDDDDEKREEATLEQEKNAAMARAAENSEANSQDDVTSDTSLDTQSVQLNFFDQNSRMLGAINPSEPQVYEDDPAKEEINSEEYYSYLKYRHGSRGKLAIQNQDIFIVWGQNGLLSVLVIFLWLIVLIFRMGSRRGCLPKLLTQISRLLTSIFFIKFCFIAISELALHDVTKPQESKYLVSYAISLIILMIYTIELIWGFYVLGKKYTQEHLETKCDLETQLIHTVKLSFLKITIF